MTEFLTADRTQEIEMVAPLFTSLRFSMNPDTFDVKEEDSSLSTKEFNAKYLIKSKPVLVD